MSDVIVADDHEAASRLAVDWLVDRLGETPAGLAVLATGNTPQRAYALAAADPSIAGLFAKLRLATLDEYAGVPPDDPRSLAGWLRRGLLAPVGFDETRLLAFDPMTTDGAAECARIESAIEAAGGIDFQILGLGPNGHLGFNEPGSAFDAPARVITLTEDSIASNAPYWGGVGQVPRTAMTLGLGQLARARRTLLLATGSAKRAIVNRTLHDPIGPQVPATILRDMAGVTVIVDRAALPSADDDGA